MTFSGSDQQGFSPSVGRAPSSPLTIDEIVGHRPAQQGAISVYLVVLGWLYVVLMMAVAEATNTTGTVLGAIVTFVLYGLVPIAIIVYVMRTPQRRAERKAREAAELAAAPSTDSAIEPNAASHAAGAAQDSGVAPVREKA
jgi:predicted membrane channel-forming protein YqfA (hemolysin III family)